MTECDPDQGGGGSLVDLSERFPTMFSSFPVVMQYNPLVDAPPSPGTHFNKATPAEAARTLKALYRSQGLYPATWEEYRASAKRVSAFEMNFQVAAAAGVSMQEARDAVEEICQELYADYWMARWLVTTGKASEW